MHAILTVGSTEFTLLVQTALSVPVLRTLVEEGYTTFTLQTGTSVLPAIPSTKLEIALHKYMDDIDAQLAAADLIISHAGVFILSTTSLPSDWSVTGAGSILAALRGPSIPSNQPINPQRKLIIVPNSSLMDDHQSQLAQVLNEQGVTTCRAEAGELVEAIQRAREVPVRDTGEGKEFRKVMDGLMGFKE